MKWDLDIVYLDSAATSLTPSEVIDATVKYYTDYNANVHRGIHTMSEEATEAYENARKKVADFINAEPEEIIFTKNTTESLNLLARCLKPKNVVLTEMEHHSNLVPWQQLSNVTYAPITNEGKLNLSEMKKLIDEKIDVVSVCHASNVLGTINPIKEISKMAHEKGALLVVDVAQSVPHMPVDVKELDADFVAFSAHKMLGPTGVGVLWGKKELLEKLDPFLFGGDMVKEVGFENTTFNDIPWKFEAGTPNISGVIGLGMTVDYLQNYGMDKVQEYTEALAKMARKMLESIGADILGPEERIGLVSFNIPGVHPHDVASILDDESIAIRGGHHCAMPLHKKLGVTGSCRASFHIYNDESDIDALEKALKKVKEVFS